MRKEFVPPGQTVNQQFYLEVLKRLCNSVQKKKDQKCGAAAIGSFTTTMALPTRPWACSSFWQKTTSRLAVIFGFPLEHSFPPTSFAFSSHIIQVTLSRTHPAHNHQQSHSFIISLVLLHVRNTTLFVSFWNISKFSVPVVEDKASLSSSQNPRPDLIMICMHKPSPHLHN